MDAVELLYDYFEDRAHAARLIRQRRPVALGLLGILVGVSSLFIASALAERSVLPFGWPALALSLLWQMALTFVMTAVLHLILELGGARGDARALFIHLGLSELVWVMAVPAVLVCQAVLPTERVRLIFFVVGLWALSFKARGIRDEYGVGGGRAWLTLGLPYLAVLVFVLLAAFLTTLGLVLAVVNAWN